ncbi:MAG: GYD domain-containing protein [Thermoleophilia bacterium]|nr:GYD domain-containing protein [Thermoleophilia bacterium]
MPIYLLLSNLTPQGVQTLKSNPDRLRQVNSDVEELGARVVHQWVTLGPYDFVNVVEAPDNETIARVAFNLEARGSTSIQTLSALTVDDFLGAIQQ